MSSSQRRGDGCDTENMFTKLSPITRSIYLEDDDGPLNYLNSLFISLATATILRVWTLMLQPPAVSLHLPQGLAQEAACITRQGPSVKSKVRGIVPDCEHRWPAAFPSRSVRRGHARTTRQGVAGNDGGGTPRTYPEFQNPEPGRVNEELKEWESEEKGSPPPARLRREDQLLCKPDGMVQTRIGRNPEPPSRLTP